MAHVQHTICRMSSTTCTYGPKLMGGLFGIVILVVAAELLQEGGTLGGSGVAISAPVDTSATLTQARLRTQVPNSAGQQTTKRGDVLNTLAINGWVEPSIAESELFERLEGRPELLSLLKLALGHIEPPAGKLPVGNTTTKQAGGTSQQKAVTTATSTTTKAITTAAALRTTVTTKLSGARVDAIPANPSTKCQDVNLPAGLSIAEYCSLVIRTSWYSACCDTPKAKWPLIVTGTPRSGTVFTTRFMNTLGLRVHDDWGKSNSFFFFFLQCECHCDPRKLLKKSAPVVSFSSPPLSFSVSLPPPPTPNTPHTKSKTGNKIRRESS